MLQRARADQLELVSATVGSRVGLGDFLEFVGSSFVSRILVRVIAHGHLAVRLFDGSIVGVSLDAAANADQQ